MFEDESVEIEIDEFGNVIEDNEDDDLGDNGNDEDSDDLDENNDEDPSIFEIDEFGNVLGSEEEDDEDIDEDEDDKNKDKPLDGSDESDDLGNEEDSSNYSLIAQALYEKGALSSLDEEQLSKIDSTDSLLEALVNDKKASEFSDLKDSQKEYLEALRAGIPEEAIKNNFSERADLESIDEDSIKENEDLRKDIITRDLELKGYSEDRIKRMVARIVDSGDDIEEAKDSLKTLIKLNKERVTAETQRQNEAKIKQKEKRDEFFNNLKESINGTDEIISGMKLNEKTKNELYKSITTPVAKNSSGQDLDVVLSSWVKDKDYSIKVHYMHMLTKGFTDFSNITKVAKSSAVEELDRRLRNDKLGARKGSPNSKGKAKRGIAALSKIKI